MELTIVLDDNNAKHLEVQKSDIGSANVVNDDCSIKDVVFQEPHSGTVPELLKVDEKSSVINSLVDDAGATVTEEHCIVTKGYDSEKVSKEVSVSSVKDDELVVRDGDAIGSIPESVQHNETNLEEIADVLLSGNSSEHTLSPLKASLSVNEGFVQKLPIITPLKAQCPHVDGSYSSIDQSAPIPEVTTQEYIQEDTPEKVKKYIELVEEESDVDDSKLERIWGEEGKNVTEDVATKDSRKGKAKSSETIDTYNDLLVKNYDIILSRTLQQQRNKSLDELSHQEYVLADFLFYSEYKYVSRLSIDEDNPTVIEENEELRHTLESLVLLEIINPANPDIHVCMSKTDFLSLAPWTWLTGASIDACSYVFNREEEKPGNPRRFWFNLLPFRKKKERIDSIISEREIDLEKAKDNPHYDTMKVEWLKDKEKMTYRDSSFFSDKYGKSMSSWEKMFPNNSIHHADLCRILQSFLQGNRIKRHSFDGLHHWKRRTIPFTLRSNQNDFDYDLVSYKENRKKQEVLKDCALWSTTKSSLFQRQTRRKDKEKHLENLQAKRVEKVFEEDQKIKEERARHEQE
ncbi:50S ribosomal protein L13, partial [Bienertia sinuspersici]